MLQSNTTGEIVVIISHFNISVNNYPKVSRMFDSFTFKIKLLLNK